MELLLPYLVAVTLYEIYTLFLHYLHYMEVLSFKLIVSNTWDLVAFTLRRTFFSITLHKIYPFCYVASAMSISSKQI